MKQSLLSEQHLWHLELHQNLPVTFFYFHKVLLISIVWLSFQSFHLSLLRPFGTVSSSELVCTEILEGYHLQLPQTLQKIGLGKTDSI